MKSLLLLLALFPSLAFSQVYVGGGGGQSHSSLSLADDFHTAGKIFAGINLKKYASVEGSYNYLGKFSSDNYRVSAHAYALDLVARYRLSHLILLARVGNAWWATEQDSSSTVPGTKGYCKTPGTLSSTVSSHQGLTGAGLHYGVGAELPLVQRVSLRLDLERFRNLGSMDVDTGTVGLKISF